MFVFIDRLADAVLLTVDAVLFGLGQMAVVSRHVFLFAVLDGGFALLKIRGLLRAQLAAGNAIGNALLLVSFASIDLIYARMTGIDDSGAGTGSCG